MNTEKKYLPTKDEIFKKIFGPIENSKITKNMLNEILCTNIEKITLDHKLELGIGYPTDKKMITDIIAKDENEKRYIIEMQRKGYPGLIKRFFGYTCKVYVSEIKVKEDYDKLKKTILIVFMEEPVKELKQTAEFHSVIELAVKKELSIDFNHIIELHVIELTKYKKYRQSGGKMIPWIEFIVNPFGKELLEMARSKEELAAAVKQLKELNADEEVRNIVEWEEWNEFWRADEIRCVREDGFEEGIKKGKKSGKKEGKKEAIISVAQKMLDKGVNVEEIMEYTGLSKEEIEKLKVTA